MNKKTLEEITEEISSNYRQIIDAWCKAYVAQIYMEDGKMPNPGDFILEQREVKESGRGWAGYEYRLKRKKDIIDVGHREVFRKCKSIQNMLKEMIENAEFAIELLEEATMEFERK